MSNDSQTARDAASFRCPVCRARQPLQNECRRCRADLSLVVRARRRADYLDLRRRQTREERERLRLLELQLSEELRQLAPSRE